MLEQAYLHLDRGEPEKALPILDEISKARALETAELYRALGDAHFQSGSEAHALAAYEAGRKAFPKDGELVGRVGAAQLRMGWMDEALKTLCVAAQKLPKDPNVHNYLGQALLRSGRAAEAEEKLKRAQSLGAGPEVKLFLALSLGRQGKVNDAEALLDSLESQAKTKELKAAVKTARADCRLFLNDARRALQLWKEVRAEGLLDPEALGHMAYAAQLSGDEKLADELMASREPSATPEDLLLFAQIANLRGQPKVALERLSRIEEALAPTPGFRFEREATKARALRLSGAKKEAAALLEELVNWPESRSGRLGAQVYVDLGQLQLDAGDEKGAKLSFERALSLDAHDPEARAGLKRTEGVGTDDDAAKAAVEGLQRRFSAREAEVDQLREELQRLKAEQQRAQEALEQARRVAAELSRKAASAEDEARRRAEAEAGKRIREELEEREREITEKAAEELSRALGGKSCPESIRSALLVAEKTYQKALYTELPAAAVAVLYTGAFERALFVFFVERLQKWLNDRNRLEQFLEEAVRERRGTRVEYFDHFVEAFDQDRPGRAPGLGEISRVLERRNEPYLKTFREFLEEYALPEKTLDAMAHFVTWTKEKLRDPVAHGHGTEMGYAELKKFRTGLLLDLGGTKRGFLSWLLPG